jgi:hypothetical protein
MAMAAMSLIAHNRSEYHHDDVENQLRKYSRLFCLSVSACICFFKDFADRLPSETDTPPFRVGSRRVTYAIGDL